MNQKMLKSYLIEFDDSLSGYDIFSIDNDSKYILLAENIAPEIIQQLIYRLLEDLKEKEIDGRKRATGTTENT